jgi:pimeloyl-ACP methyl ester carboxylesterase
MPDPYNATGDLMTELHDDVVLVPPMGGDERCWDEIDLAEIGIPAERVRKYVFPGHGSRARHPGMTFSSMADDLAEQVPETFHLVAVAAGVSIAAQFMLRHPGRVRSAVLICAGFSPRPGEEERAAAEVRGDRAVEEGMQSVLAEMAVRWFSPWAIAARHPGLQYSQACLTAMDPEAWRDVWGAVRERITLSTEEIESFDAPMSLVAALGDSTSGVKNLQAAHRMLSTSRLEYVPGPHMLHLERPDEVLAALERHFLWLSSGPERVEHPRYFTTD